MDDALSDQSPNDSDADDSDTDELLSLTDVRVAFVGKMGGVSRREARQLVRRQGGIFVDDVDETVNLIVIGADELPMGEPEQLLDAATRSAAAEGRVEIITETLFWQRLGLVDNEQSVRRLYTPAMLAQLLGISVSHVRRWHRRGLIQPAREVHKLPYFEFQEIATARRLAQLVAAGASPAAIEKKLASLSEFVPNVDRPIAQLNVLVEGKEILLRQGEGLLEPSGQMRIDFDALERGSEVEESTLSFEAAVQENLSDPIPAEIKEFGGRTPQELESLACEFEEQGSLDDAIEVCRALMVGFGPKAESCFQLAELLYRTGDVSGARERYYMAIELDEDYVEARANLGCVLAETGQIDLAIAAFEGALKYHPDYPDVHFHLAQVLDRRSHSELAESHWRRFLSLSPNSPWADEARERLGLVDPGLADDDL